MAQYKVTVSKTVSTIVEANTKQEAIEKAWEPNEEDISLAEDFDEEDFEEEAEFIEGERICSLCNGVIPEDSALEEIQESFDSIVHMKCAQNQ